MDMNDTREDGKWGAPIEVSGVKPDWLEHGTPGMFENTPDQWLDDTDDVTAWSWSKNCNDGKGCPIHIRLKADHPHYKHAPSIDWTAPIEAVHEDGRVAPVTYRGLDDDSSGDHLVTVHHPEAYFTVFRPDGTPWIEEDGWRIRNVAQTTRTTDEQLTHYAERCKALVEKMVASGPSHLDGPWLREARAIVASMVEVDGDLVRVREICAYFAENTLGDAGLAREYRAGECDEQFEVKTGVAAIRRGRALERGEC